MKFEAALDALYAQRTQVKPTDDSTFDNIGRCESKMESAVGS
jgi:hypothetical protein